MELDFNRLSEMGVVILPCPFENGSFTVISQDGSRKGRVKPDGDYWVAIFQKDVKGRSKKIEEAIRLLL